MATFDADKCPEDMKLSNDNMTVTKLHSTRFSYIPIFPPLETPADGSDETAGEYLYTFRLETELQSVDGRIFVAPLVPEKNEEEEAAAAAAAAAPFRHRRNQSEGVNGIDVEKGFGLVLNRNHEAYAIEGYSLRPKPRKPISVNPVSEAGTLIELRVNMRDKQIDAKFTPVSTEEGGAGEGGDRKRKLKKEAAKAEEEEEVKDGEWINIAAKGSDFQPTMVVAVGFYFDDMSMTLLDYSDGNPLVKSAAKN